MLGFLLLVYSIKTTILLPQKKHKSRILRKFVAQYATRHMKILSHITHFCSSARAGELVRFGIVGTLATLIQYGVYYLFNQLVGLGANTSLTIGYVISFIFNFFLSNYFTFNTRPTVKKGIGFGLSHLLNYLLQIAFINLYMYMGIAEAWAPLPMFVTVVPINFLLVRYVLNSPKL